MVVKEIGNKFVLYRHIRPDKNEPFYIGIGEPSRAFDFKWGRNKHWRNIFKVNNNTIEVEIMMDNLSWIDVCKKEQEFIKLYGREDLGLGALCNLTDGGEGAYGRSKSKETIEKQKKTLLDNGRTLSPMEGKKHTPDAIEKIREAGRRKKTQEEIDKTAKTKASRDYTEIYKRFSETRKGIKTGRIPINIKKVINTITGIEYLSILEASIATGITKTTMNRWCHNNKNGYKFI